jgi:hypothetical protein
MSTCVFSLMCLLVLSGDVRAQQQPDPPQPPTCNYTCTGFVVHCGKRIEIIGEGNSCPVAKENFNRKLAEIVRTPCDPEAALPGEFPLPPIVVGPCKCEDKLQYGTPRCRVIYTCTACNGQVFSFIVDATSVTAGHREAREQKNSLFQLLGWRTCTDSCCAIPIPASQKK